MTYALDRSRKIFNDKNNYNKFFLLRWLKDTLALSLSLSLRIRLATVSLFTLRDTTN